MIANMRMAKKSRRPICRRGTMAFMIDFSTICRPRERGESEAQTLFTAP
jgi:tartrate dehydratase alpha subunit/fumarate hydratase class I-like protein